MAKFQWFKDKSTCALFWLPQGLKPVHSGTCAHQSHKITQQPCYDLQIGYMDIYGLVQRLNHGQICYVLLSTHLHIWSTIRRLNFLTIHFNVTMDGWQTAGGGRNGLKLCPPKWEFVICLQKAQLHFKGKHLRFTFFLLATTDAIKW